MKNIKYGTNTLVSADFFFLIAGKHSGSRLGRKLVHALDISVREMEL
jgi:hypothetical protein